MKALHFGLRGRSKTLLRPALIGMALPFFWIAFRPGEDLPLRAGEDPQSLAQESVGLIHLPLLLRAAARPWSPPLVAFTPEPTRSPEASHTPARSATPDPSTPDPLTPDPATPFPATAVPSEFTPFGLVRIEPDMMLEGSGSVVDSIAFWEAPDPADSLMLVTAKGNQRVEVWQQPFEGRELPALQHPSFGSGTQVNGIVVDQQRDLLYIATSRPASTVSVFSLPDLAFLRQIVEAAVDLRSEPNLALLELPEGSSRLYVSADNRVYIYDPESGQALGEFETAAPLETLLADDFQQRLYIPDEVGRTGIYAYRPDGEPYLREGTARFGDQDVFQADAEGITHYRCLDAAGLDDGRGWMIVADQRTGSSDFEFFDRQTWAHLGRLQLEGVSFTDGIASTQQALPRHPAGLFAALNNDRGVGLIGWDRILEATGLGCGVGGRQAGAMLQKADHAPAKEAQAERADASRKTEIHNSEEQPHGFRVRSGHRHSRAHAGHPGHLARRPAGGLDPAQRRRRELEPL